MGPAKAHSPQSKQLTLRVAPAPAISRLAFIPLVLQDSLEVLHTSSCALFPCWDMGASIAWLLLLR